jgi:hypothetical protein
MIPIWSMSQDASILLWDKHEWSWNDHLQLHFIDVDQNFKMATKIGWC